MMRSALSVTHFWARRNTFPRSSKPRASHAGCAARALATISLTSSAVRSGTVVMISPVAGFSTGIPVLVPFSVSAPRCSTVAMPTPSRLCALTPEPTRLAAQPVSALQESAHQRQPPERARVRDDLVGPRSQPALQQAGVDRAEVERDLEVVLAVEA